MNAAMEIRVDEGKKGGGGTFDVCCGRVCQLQVKTSLTSASHNHGKPVVSHSFNPNRTPCDAMLS